jgi:glycosyltransferase involved in cell wall biosynthesis
MRAETISVAMCTYNGATHLREQLASIAAQTRPPDELVVCDDCSTDETAEVVREFASAAPFPVRLHVNEVNLGSTRNFGKAISLCAGDIIALSDQDDVWLPRKLERFAAEFAAAPGAGLVFSDGEVVDENLRPLGYNLWQSLYFDPDKQRKFREGLAFETLLLDFCVTGAAMAFRSRFRELVLPIHEATLRGFGRRTMHFIHDGWVALVIAAVAELGMIDEALIKYRQHARQQLGLRPPEKMDDASQGRGVANWGEQAGTSYAEYLASELSVLEEIYGRLWASGEEAYHRVALAKLGPKITHLRARTGLPANKLRRVPLVLRELLTARYFRYSNGVRSAAKDLLL